MLCGDHFTFLQLRLLPPLHTVFGETITSSSRNSFVPKKTSQKTMPKSWLGLRNLQQQPEAAEVHSPVLIHHLFPLTHSWPYQYVVDTGHKWIFFELNVNALKQQKIREVKDREDSVSSVSVGFLRQRPSNTSDARSACKVAKWKLRRLRHIADAGLLPWLSSSAWLRPACWWWRQESNSTYSLQRFQ